DVADPAPAPRLSPVGGDPLAALGLVEHRRHGTLSLPRLDTGTVGVREPQDQQPVRRVQPRGLLTPQLGQRVQALGAREGRLGRRSPTGAPRPSPAAPVSASPTAGDSPGAPARAWPCSRWRAATARRCGGLRHLHPLPSWHAASSTPSNSAWSPTTSPSATP